MTARVIRVGSGGRRRRLGSTTAGRRSARTADPITVDLCFSTPGCIDLTIDGDDGDDDAEVVAFTSYTDDGVVCLGERSNPRSESRNISRRTTRPVRSRASSRSPIVLERVELSPIVLDNQGLPVLFDREPVEIPVIKVSDTEENNEHHHPPRNKEIICPICLEEHTALSSMNKQLVSTICGHLFCNECIKTAIRSAKCCPTCRKRLTVKQFHPIFL